MLHKSRSAEQDAHGHILFVYSKRQEKFEVLANYLRDGLGNHELCIMVTPDSTEKVIKDLQSAGLDVSKAVEDKDLRIFEMEPSYLPHGKFVANHMLLNVVNFIAEAKAKGYNGVRTAGEMAWLYDHPDYLDEAAEYEELVNRLPDNSPEFTGMCLYPVHNGSNKDIDRALQTHPSHIFDGTIQTNPFRTPKPVYQD
jgi:hypothetical protein